VSALLACIAVLFLCASVTLAQSAATGALTGTVTDPSGAIIAGATVTATNIDTGQARTDTSNVNGSYKLSLLPPGAYSVKFSAAGFKTSEVASVTVNATETAVLNQSLSVGAQSEQITVESTTERLQTQNATMGSLVGSHEVTTLPLSSRNYTQIIDLSPGVVVNVASAAAVGNGTQDINVNGMGSDQNNYMMDGATLTNYGSGGGANSGNFPGIGIPNADSIAEFKIQTSQYDAEYGRNPGASVNVVTRGGTNDFHGNAWEFFRNSFLDANDFFNKHSDLALQTANKPETLNENLFGGTIGGPIKKDKLFFFGSYQGIRQLNGIGASGSGSGLTTGLTLLPFNEPDGTRADEAGSINQNFNPAAPTCNYNTYRGYLGCVFAGSKSYLAMTGGSQVTINPPNQTTLSDSNTNISNTAVNLLRAKGPAAGVSNGFYIPSVPFRNGSPVSNCYLPVSATNPACNAFVLSSPIRANEDQYLANVDYVVNAKNTLSERLFLSTDPQDTPFVCLGACQPGSPEDVKYTADSAVLKLTTVVTNNFVNEAFFSYQRSSTVAAPGNYFTACSVGITPPLAQGNCSNLSGVTGVNPIVLQVPVISTDGEFGATANGGGLPLEGPWVSGGNFFASATNYFNYFQGNEQISWNHGKHALRTGFWVNRIQYNWTLPGRGSLGFANTVDFLTSSSGLPATGTAATGGAENEYGVGEANGNTHDLRTNEFAAFVEDDIKVTRKLTLNLGLRWEYDGYPSDNSGLFTNVWASAAAQVNTGSFFLGPQVANGPGTMNNTVGTLAGFAVQSNYNPNLARCGNPLVPSACGLSAPAGIFNGYPGGATGVTINNNKTLVHGAPIDDFGPRIGMAWQPFSDKFVIRAGYGIFYDAVYANLLANNQGAEPPYNGVAPISTSASLDQPLYPIPTTPPLLGWVPRTLRVNAGSPTYGATNITDDNGAFGLTDTSDSEFLGSPLVQQFNLDLQYEVSHGWVVDVGYVGSHGTHLYDWSRPVNVAFLAPNAYNEPTDPQNERMIIGSGARGTPNSFVFNDAGNTNPSTQILENIANTTPGNPGYPGNYLGRVSYLGYSAGGLGTTSTYGDSLYNSLQAQLRHQFSKGLLLQVSYTWSKSITNVNGSEGGGGIAGGGNVLSGGAGSNDPLDLGQQYGLAAFNRPQRLVIAYSYELPYRRRDGFAGHVFGGWSISGITTIQNGEPFTVDSFFGGSIYYGAGGNAFCSNCNVRAELAAANTGKCSVEGVCQSIGVASGGSNYARVVNGLNHPGTEGWVNTSAYTSPPCIGGIPNPGGGSLLDQCGEAPNEFYPGDPGYPFVGAGTGFGDSGVGAISGPGQSNWDMSFIKQTKVTEATNIEFRAEFYNIWNHPQFSPPSNYSDLGTLGQITSSSVPPRVVQFALKFSF
jgi:hypothetical protein